MPQQGSAAVFSVVHTEQDQSSLNAIDVLRFAVEALARVGSEGMNDGMGGAAVETEAMSAQKSQTGEWRTFEDTFRAQKHGMNSKAL